MPKMFAEEDLDAFQRLRCSFDPAGLANPGKLMPTPRLCGEVPGPVPAASAGGGRAGGAVLRPETRSGGGEAAARAASGRSGRSAAGRSRGCAARDEEPLETGGLDRILEHNVGDFTAVLEAGVPFAEAQATFAEHGQRLAWDPPDPGGATIGGIVATGGLAGRCATATAACATSWSGIIGRAERRHDRQVRRQGDQERRGL